MSHSVLAVANKLLRRGRRQNVRLTPMHLQKLCYMSQGFALAFFNDRLIEDGAQAWAYGPVYPALYDALKRFGSGEVDELIRERNWSNSSSFRGEIVTDDFTDQENGIIKQVFDTYARYPAFQLSALTHETGSPWEQVYESGVNAEIPEEMMKAYFSGLARQPA